MTLPARTGSWSGHVEVSGISTYVEVHGDGPPLVLLHDRLGSHTTWRHQLGPLAAAGLRVVTYDARGLGASGPALEPYTTTDLADDVVALLDALDLGRAVLVGLSMGGGVAQACALARPDRVAGLVLVSSGSAVSERARARFLADADAAEVHGIDAAVPAMLEKWYSAAYRHAHPKAMARAAAELRAVPREAVAARSRANAARALTGRLGEIACPVLVVAGELDPADGVGRDAAYRAARGERCRTVVVPGVSHMVPVEAPDVLNALLVDFARSLPPFG